MSSSFSNPESHSPRRRRRHRRRRRRRRRRCISVVVSLCDTRKFTLVLFRLHSRTSRSFCLVPRFVWPSVTLPPPLPLSFSLSFSLRETTTWCVGAERHRGIFADALFSRLLVITIFFTMAILHPRLLSLFPHLHTPQTARVAVGAKFQSNLAEFQDFRYEWRYDTSSRWFWTILPFLIPVPVLSTISRTLPGDLSILTAHLVVCYERSFFTFFYFDAVFDLFTFFSP